MSGALSRDSSDQGVVPGTAYVRTAITFLILAQMGQVRSLSKSTQTVDVDGVVA